MPRTYSPQWDLTTIPDDVFKSEHARRNGIKGGRPQVLERCPTCHRLLTARERRLPCPAHSPATHSA